MTGRVWVITGASSGFGLAIASYALMQGERVVVTVRSPSKFPQSLKDAGARPIFLDMTSTDEVIKKAADDAIQVYGHVDVLVNNAGSVAIGSGPLEELSMNDIRQLFQVNLFSMLAFSQPFITHFRLRRAGHILNMSSGWGVLSVPGAEVYGATKSAMNMFTDNLALELRAFDVKVHLILPGCFYDTGIWPSEDAPPVQAIGPYTETETQGFDPVGVQRRRSAERGQAGDTQELAVRIYEIVAGIGLAGDAVRDTEHPGVVWVPLGSDSVDCCREKFSGVLQRIDALEPVWKSTDISGEPLAEMCSKFGVRK